MYCNYCQDLIMAVDKELPKQIVIAFKMAANSETLMKKAYNHERYKFSTPEKVKAVESLEGFQNLVPQIPPVMKKIYEELKIQLD